MKLWIRMVLLLVVAGGIGGLTLLAIPAGNPEVAAQTKHWESSQQCQQCHAEVWDEWQGSHHQISYLNPEVRKLSEDFRNKECAACHLPRPVTFTGYGERVLPRLTNPDEGVSCLTCHLAADGTILGRHDRPDVACAPHADADFLKVDMCQSCHNQHYTTDQWRASTYAKEGVNCNDCHMPEVARKDGSQGRSHVFSGAHDIDTLRRAGKLAIAVDGGDMVFKLTNVGAGHNFPTEERHRAVDIMVRFVLADGTQTPWQRSYRYRQPYRDEPGENTQLPSGATHESRTPIVAGAKTAQIRMWYRLTPYVGDDDPLSTLLLEKEVELP